MQFGNGNMLLLLLLLVLIDRSECACIALKALEDNMNQTESRIIRVGKGEQINNETKENN